MTNFLDELFLHCIQKEPPPRDARYQADRDTLEAGGTNRSGGGAGVLGAIHAGSLQLRRKGRKERFLCGTSVWSKPDAERPAEGVGADIIRPRSAYPFPFYAGGRFV